MKKKYTVIGIIVIVALLLLSFISCIFLTFQKDESSPFFDYVKADEYDYETVIDGTSIINKLDDVDKFNFNDSGMTILSTSYGELNGISTTLLNQNFENVLNLSNTSYLTPFYQSSEIEGFISGTRDATNKQFIKHWNKSGYELMRDYPNTKYDHEMIRYMNNDYILDGSNIWIIGDENQKFYFDDGDSLGLPSSMDENGERISSPAGYHFNSFDIYGENIVLNSRDYGVIFSLKILNTNGSLKEKEDFELNWVLCGNSITPWYIEQNYNDDGTWENPIISNGGTSSATYYNYDENEDYEPIFFSEWNDKLLKIEVDGNVYDFSDIDQAKEFNLLDNEHKFWGAHTVRVINTYLESISDTLNGYNPDNLYISIHDNHFPSDVVYKYTDPEIHGVDWGDDPYSFHAYTDKTKSIFGDNPYSIDNDMHSFTKIYEINTETMTAKEVLNRDNNVSDEINEFSDYRSSSTFFSINGQSYLITESSLNSSFVFTKFDGIDFESGELINEELILEIQWKGAAAGYIHYRTYPIFTNIENVAYGWNALNTSPYS